MYDIIGDIHGHADELELLLAKLDYQRIDGVWQHAERTLISVGDLIDRGPQQKRTVDILKSMSEHGAAHVIQGNHEFSAVAFATADEQGEPLRPHTKKNQEQHHKFLLEAQSDPAWYQQTIEWFKSLPILLELADFRVVHACWHPESIAVLKQYANDNFVLHEDAWIAANQEGHPLYTALEVLMKGWEIQLPDGCSFLDFANHPRNKIRTRWWLQDTADYQQFAISVPDITMLPKKQVDNKLMVGYDNHKPLFIGHYWLEGIPCCLSEHIACLDWSVTERGTLVAYRTDDNKLDDKNFHAVPGRKSVPNDVERLNKAFYLSDPMNTCCVENECYDEYQRIANYTKTLLDDNVALFDAIKKALVSSFDDMVKDQHVCAVMKSIANLS